MSIPTVLHPTKLECASFWDISISDSPYAQSIASVHPNSYCGFGPDDAEAFARLTAAAPAILDAARPVADCVFAFSGDDDEYISVTAGELRALAAAISKAEGRS